MQKTMSAWIRLVATERDRRLLDEISRRNGDAGFSATVRRLIREEAARLGIDARLPDGQDLGVQKRTANTTLQQIATETNGE